MNKAKEKIDCRKKINAKKKIEKMVGANEQLKLFYKDVE